MDRFLPTTFEQGKRYYKDFDWFDVIFITGDPYYDHPLSGTALLARLLEKKGYKVGIVPQPETDDEFLACGSPKYFFCVTSGLLDSMLANYTPMLKKRENVLVPERALITYTGKIKQLFKGKMTVIGGVEATIRRFTHFDYKDNKLRRGILSDSKADLLLFGNADRSILTLLERLKKFDHVYFDKVKDKLELSTIDGLAYRIKENEKQNLRELPSYEECVADKNKFNLLTMNTYLLPDDAFIERCGAGIIRHNRMSHPLTDDEMDYVYSVPFTRKLHPDGKQLFLNKKMLEGFENSVIIGRGCWGSCSFCIIPLVQGKNVSKRSIKSITGEIESLFKNGTKKINDLTLPTINMYGSYCALYDEKEIFHSPITEKDVEVYNKTKYCDQNCVGCKFRVLRDDLYPLLLEVEKLNRKYSGELEIRSAIRHDIILSQKPLFEKIMEFTKRLKIAPEHISDSVLRGMNKADKKAFEDFLVEYARVNKKQGTDKPLVPYFVVAHPGTTEKEMEELSEFCKKHRLFVNLTQVFTPTPGTLSTAMYYSGKDPRTKKDISVPRAFREKKDQKNKLLGRIDENDENA